MAVKLAGGDGRDTGRFRSGSGNGGQESDAEVAEVEGEKRKNSLRRIWWWQSGKANPN
jgi:hypothetical protein